MKKLNYRRKALILSSVIFLMLVVIYSCGMVISTEEMTGSFLNAKQPPGMKFIFGTDILGRDLFLRTMKGLSVSLTVGIASSVASAVIAVIIGVATAMGSRLMDHIISWLIDLMMSVPHTILIILISFALGRGLKGLMIGIIATHWCTLARLIRGEVLQLRSRQYIMVSQRLGKSQRWILMHHMLPHLLPQLIIGVVLMFPHAILHEATISFLGFGLPPEQAAIGIILAESMQYLSIGMWWTAVLPGMTLVLIVLLIDKLGEYLRMILDPYSAQK